MLITLSRRTAIFLSVAEVLFTCVALLAKPQIFKNMSKYEFFSWNLILERIDL
jgi:hypothetical protein